MRDRGLTVGWLDRHSLALILNRIGNATFSAPRRDAILALVVMRHRMPVAALSAWLPPLSVSQFASRMNSLVVECRNQLQVLDPVVELAVLLSMMDEVASRDWSVVLLPNNVVFHSEALLFGVPDTSIALGGNCSVSTRSRTLWSAFSHCESPFTQHSTNIDSRSSSRLSEDAAFAQYRRLVASPDSHA